jgi:hypothetical protein
MKELVEVLLVAINSVTVVVARLVVPTTVRLPFVRRFPAASARKLRFSVHADPFQ